jgi:hypothetical protein
LSERVVPRISIVATLVILASVFYSNVSRQARWVEVPHACDWFIFLRQAQLFQQRGLIGGLDTAIRDANTRYLIEKAKSLHPTHPALMPAVGPYCHEYKERTDRLSIVSPPGTGLALSFFPPGRQERLVFITSSTIILLFLAAVVLRARSWRTPVVAGALGVLCFSGMYKFVHDWSIQPSVVLVLLAGYLAVRAFDAAANRLGLIWAILLGISIGAAADFRLANAFLAFGIAVGFGTIFLKGLRMQAVCLSAAFAAGFMVGSLPLLLANAINAGDPFTSTYGAANTQALRFDWETFRRGFEFYFIERATVAGLIAVPAIALAALALMRRKLALGGVEAALVCAATNLAASVGFFLFYVILQWYYPFPAIVFAASVAAFVFIRSEIARPPPGFAADVSFRLAAGGVLVGTIIAMLFTVSMPVSENFSRPDVHVPLPERSVVWAGISGGYFHLFLGRQAALLSAVDPPSQDALISAIARDGVRQFVVADLDSAPMVERLKQTAELRLAGSAFTYDVFEIISAPRATAPAN